jgi:hypothetical protein
MCCKEQGLCELSASRHISVYTYIVIVVVDVVAAELVV